MAGRGRRRKDGERTRPYAVGLALEAEEMVLLTTFWLMLSAMDTAERPLLLLKMLLPYSFDV